MTTPALDKDGEVVLHLTGGFTLRSGGEVFTSGEYVRLCDPDGCELLYWDKEEWATDPALVVGAIINAAITAPIDRDVMHNLHWPDGCETDHGFALVVNNLQAVAEGLPDA